MNTSSLLFVSFSVRLFARKYKNKQREVFLWKQFIFSCCEPNSCLRKVRLNGERRFYLFRNNVWMYEMSYAGLSCGFVTVLEFVVRCFKLQLDFRPRCCGKSFCVLCLQRYYLNVFHNWTDIAFSFQIFSNYLINLKKFLHKLLFVLTVFFLINEFSRNFSFKAYTKFSIKVFWEVFVTNLKYLLAKRCLKSNKKTFNKTH